MSPAPYGEAARVEKSLEQVLACEPRTEIVALPVESVRTLLAEHSEMYEALRGCLSRFAYIGHRYEIVALLDRIAGDAEPAEEAPKAEPERPHTFSTVKAARRKAGKDRAEDPDGTSPLAVYCDNPDCGAGGVVSYVHQECLGCKRGTARVPEDDRSEPEPEAPAPLTEERVREIVREEVRRDGKPAAPSEPVPVRVGQVRTSGGGDYYVQALNDVGMAYISRMGSMVGFRSLPASVVKLDRVLYDPTSEEGEQAQEGE